MHPAHDYPWVPASVPLVRLNSPVIPDDSATLIVAVGSNASPAVMRAKLGRDVGLFGLRVGNLAVGHSAHVSARGYIPATPLPAPGATLDTVGVWLNANELAALDITEPNYDRLTVTTHDHPLTSPIRSGHPEISGPTHFDLYRSRHGALGDAGGTTPLAFGDQQHVIDWLHARTGDQALRGHAAQVCPHLAEPAIAAAVTAGMRAHGLALPIWPGLASPKCGGGI